jgi:hypothetical protein
MPDNDLADALAQFTNYVMNERVRCYNEGVDAGRATEFDYLSKVRRNLIEWLAGRYIISVQSARAVGSECDEHIDKSGRLLGEVREAVYALSNGKP